MAIDLSTLLQRMLRSWLPRSLHVRLLGAYLTLMAVSVGGLIVWMGLRLQSAVLEQAEHDLEIQAFVLANALRDPLEVYRSGAAPDGRSLADLVRSYAPRVGGRVTVLDHEFTNIYSSDDRVPTSVVEVRPSEAAPDQTAMAQPELRWDVWSQEERLFVAAPVVETGGDLFAYVQLSVPSQLIYAEMGRIWVTLLLMAGIVVTITAALSLVLAYQIANPIQTLMAATETMADGDLAGLVNPQGPDEIERLGHAFNRLAKRIREMLGRQQAFAAHAAHELRSPLTSLRLRLEMLQTYSPSQDERTQRYLAEMEHEVNHLQRQIDHLLALTVLDEDQDLPRVALDLAPLLYSLADEVGLLVQEAGLTLEVNVPSHLPPIYANIDQMRMAVRNLLDNAIKYTPAGGRIVLSAQSDLRRVEVSVMDTGIGIPTEALPHIFERFYRVDKARSRRQGGTGLGLALVRGIAEAHGGRVEVNSQAGQGSVFILRLPRPALLP